MEEKEVIEALSELQTTLEGKTKTEIKGALEEFEGTNKKYIADEFKGLFEGEVKAVKEDILAKLKVTQDRQTHRVRKDKLELRDWVKNELLDLSSNKPITEELLNLLSEHIQNEGLFARRIKLNAERQRIKEAARIVKVRGGSNQFF